MVPEGAPTKEHAELVVLTTRVLDYLERLHLARENGASDDDTIRKYLGPTLAKWYLRVSPVALWLYGLQQKEAWPDARRLMQEWLPELAIDEKAKAQIDEFNANFATVSVRLVDARVPSQIEDRSHLGEQDPELNIRGDR